MRNILRLATIVAVLCTATLLAYAVILSHADVMKDVMQRAQYLDSRAVPHVAPRDPGTANDPLKGR